MQFMAGSKRRVKGILTVLIALGLVAGLSAAMLAQRPAEDVVATVNGEVIHERDLYNEMVRRVGRQVLDEMVNELLMRQAVAKAGVEIPDERVTAEMERVKSRLPEGVSVEDALAAAGLTEEEWADDIRLDLSLRELLTARVEVTEEEIAAFFEQYKDFLGTEERVRVRHILVATEEEAEAVREELLAGADFAELAREKSTDRGSAIQGGDLGWVSRNQMVKPFEDAAFAAEVGEISPVIKTDFGYHVLRVEDRQEAKEASLEESRDEIREYLLQDKLQAAFQDWMEEIRAEADIETFL